ncbi:hypothetical protein [Sulfurospirillum barnesii]|nr:hypothetical protein [Sulfurospirillum barnesii]
MAIKITYIFLKTLSLTLQIPLLACDGFLFNEGNPIRAMRNLYFVKKEGVISTERFAHEYAQNFSLPEVLEESYFNHDNEPLYMLPAV